MRFFERTSAAVLLAAAAAPAGAQIRIERSPAPSLRVVRTAVDEPRAVIGVSTSSGATSRDTLGVLVGAVRADSPAEQAGIREGDRIEAINGVSLRLAPADVGDEQTAGAMTRRLSRELKKVQPGDTVELRVVSGMQHKTISVKTVDRDALDERSINRREGDRATLGLDLALTGTSRDTIGVFVMGVVDGGPAAQAGIEEGSRIASINGVDVRGVRAGDDIDYRDLAANVRRLEREVARAKPGDAITLRVYYDKHFRDVRVQAGRASDLPRRARALTIVGGGGVPLMREMPMPRIFGAPDGFALEMPGRFELRSDFGDSIARLFDGARAWPGLPGLGTRLDW